MLLLSKFAENTYVKLVAGLTLLLTSLYDLITESEAGLQSEHGIIVFSLLHILGSCLNYNMERVKLPS